MKKFFSYTMYIGLLAMALNLTSCQDEFEEINNGEEPQAIEANSSTADLIQRTSSNDGSSDNIVDGTSCFQIKFPYTVEVNGLTLTIESKDDLETIEEIFDSIDDDENILDIIFPITVTAGDFTEITVNGLQDLRELAAECKEGGEDDDIECIDFVYPMTLYTFNVNLEQTSTVQVESDRELRLFFKDLGSDSLVSFDFPITLKLYDDTTIEVANHRELASAIENAKDDCDEDDDDDYNDDDFNEDELNSELIECVWFVTEFRRNDVDQTQQYVNYILNFKGDGTVSNGFDGATVIEGTWSTKVGDDGAKLTMEFENSTDFNLEWNVYDLGDDKIKLFSGDGNRVIMKQFCGEDLQYTNVDTLREILKECAWIIKDIELQNEDFDRVLGYEFQFMAEGVVTLSNGVNISEGTWDIKLNTEQILVLAIEITDEPGVNFEWPIREMFNNRLKFEADEIGYELDLQRVCENSITDADVLEIRDFMMGGDWIVASYVEDNVDMTNIYGGYSLSFIADNQVSIMEGGEVFGAGLWRVLRNSEEKLKVFLNFGENNPFNELTDDWEVVSVVDGRIELKDISGDGSITTLVLEK
ncbi:hypothetical protein [Maribacter sp. MAR_2009_72]|uniref:hypothetical protein n=1 Tax=Maribacter sp. MAR_2009_72 TaxID=1250050 RepID=UPI00119BAE54|nr:hypothetical protein [Maribacter sp. MAR_2009_72]TVZ16885.1 hypothetical protein JM81_3157 [Maribacter sp. MAR_2009_72]